MKFALISRLFLIPLLLSSFTSLAQVDYSAGFKFTSLEKERIILDFKKPLTDKYSVITGVSFGWSKDYYLLGPVEWSNSLRTQRASSNFYRNVNLRLGVARRLKTSAFSVGINAVLGYQHSSRYNFNTGSFFDEESSRWLFVGMSRKPQNDFQSEDFETNVTRLDINYIRAGINPTISGEIPINKKLVLNVNAGIYGGLITNLAADNSKSPNPIAEPQAFTSTLIELQPQLGVSVYYNFGIAD